MCEIILLKWKMSFDKQNARNLNTSHAVCATKIEFRVVCVTLNWMDNSLETKKMSAYPASRLLQTPQLIK